MCLKSILDKGRVWSKRRTCIPGEHLVEITPTTLLLPASPNFTGSTLPRAGTGTAPHRAQPYPGQLQAQAKREPKSLVHRKLREEKFARATLCFAWRGEDITAQSHA